MNPLNQTTYTIGSPIGRSIGKNIVRTHQKLLRFSFRLLVFLAFNVDPDALLAETICPSFCGLGDSNASTVKSRITLIVFIEKTFSWLSASCTSKTQVKSFQDPVLRSAYSIKPFAFEDVQIRYRV